MRRESSGSVTCSATRSRSSALSASPTASEFRRNSRAAGVSRMRRKNALRLSKPHPPRAASPPRGRDPRRPPAAPQAAQRPARAEQGRHDEEPDAAQKICSARRTSENESPRAGSRPGDGHREHPRRLLRAEPRRARRTRRGRARSRPRRRRASAAERERHAEPREEDRELERADRGAERVQDEGRAEVGRPLGVERGEAGVDVLRRARAKRSASCGAEQAPHEAAARRRTRPACRRAGAARKPRDAGHEERRARAERRARPAGERPVRDEHGEPGEPDRGVRDRHREPVGRDRRGDLAWRGTAARQEAGAHDLAAERRGRRHEVHA